MTFEDDDDFDEVVPIQVPRWIKQTDRVIDAYAKEVENLRVEVRTISQTVQGLETTIAELLHLKHELEELLKSDE